MTTDITTTNINNEQITLQQFFDFVKKSDNEKLDDILSIEPATLKYLQLFHKRGQKFFLSWNWSAFFTSGWQLCYRKLYLFTLVLCVVELIVSYLLTKKFFIYNKANDTHLNYQLLEYLLLIVPSFLTALMANWLYLRHAKICIMKDQTYKRGVSVKAVILGIILLNILYFMERFGVLLNI